MGALLRDLRIGVRQLWQNRGFTTVAVLTLALGIGANAAIFSVIYATFFEPLPYRDPERLVMVWLQRVSSGGTSVQMVPARDYVEWKRQATVFDDLEAWSGWTATVTTDAGPEQVQIGPATPRFLPMLGYGHPLALGRDFLVEEGTPGRDQVVILTHRIWRERFGGDPNVIGRQLRIDRKPYTIVGVLGAGPADENQARMWVPLALTPDQLNTGRHFLLVMGRLKAGVTVEQANASMEVLSASITGTARSAAPEWKPSVQPFRNNFLSEGTKRGLWLLLAAVGFLLLIACANVANLLLARATVRKRELAVRAALGASRGQIVRQLLAESVVLASFGGIAGVALAAGLVQVVVALMPPFMLPTEAHVRLNGPVLLFTVAACALTSILSGSVPAWLAARADVNDALKEGGRSQGVGGGRLRNALVAVEFALALTLLTAGGLAIRSLVSLVTEDLGFREDRVLTFGLPADRDRFSGAEQIAAFYRQVLDRVRALPGVVSASVSTGMPLRGWARVPFTVAGSDPAEESQRPSAELGIVTPEYFETFGIPIARGRSFTEQDRAGGLPVAIVDESFVRRHLADVDPFAQRIVLAAPMPGASKPGTPSAWQIIGVVPDVGRRDPASEPLPKVYLPFWQTPWPTVRVAVRTAGDPAGVQQSIAAIVQSIDAELPMADVKTMEQVVSESLVRDRFNSVLFGGFALLGLLLAAFGVYGVMSFAVAQRRQEIGVRVALGATRARIVWQVLAEGMMTAGVGTVVGSLGAFYAARTMRGMVFSASEMDAAALAAVTAALLTAAVIACLVPAFRAASVDPTLALRDQ